MKTYPDLERAHSYLSLNLTPGRRGPAVTPPSPRPFVTLSREAGAGATTLANTVVKILNRRTPTLADRWEVFDGNLVEAMLSDGDYPDHLAQFLPEDTLSEVDASIGEILGLHPNLWEMIQRTNRLIRRLALRGNCILIGRAANFVTADLPRGMHLRLIAHPDDRMRHMADHLAISHTEARLRNQRRDAARRRYVKGHYNRDVGDPRHYDMVIHTSNLSAPEIAAMLVALIAARTPVSTS